MKEGSMGSRPHCRKGEGRENHRLGTKGFPPQIHVSGLQPFTSTSGHFENLYTGVRGATAASERLGTKPGFACLLPLV